MFHYTQADVTNTAVPSLAPTRVLGFSIWFDWFTGTDPGLKQAKGAPSWALEFSLCDPHPTPPLAPALYSGPCCGCSSDRRL